MTTFNTGNPVPSADARDRFDNSQSFDELVTGTERTTVNRLGRSIKTVRGFELDAAEALATGVYNEVGDYAAGLEITSYNQIFRYNGEFYRAKPDTELPFTMTGTPATDLLSFISVGDAALRTLLASATGAEHVRYRPIGQDTVVQSTAEYMNALKTVEAYGIVLDGETDAGPGIRRALDDLHELFGGEVILPWGSVAKVVDPIFIPQRIPTVGVAGCGIVLRGFNTTIIGDGVSNVFESGTGRYSTVAKGGATNWGLGDEQPNTIHYNSRIEGFNFRSCKNAIKVHNFIQGCAIKECYATDFTESMVWTNRSFYLTQMDLVGRPFRSDRPDTMPIFRYEGFNNTMAFSGLHASGLGPDTYTHGYGFLFDGGVEAVSLTNGISAEAVKGGLVLKSVVYSMDVAMYFELCDTAILSVGANLNHLNIDNCRFNACSTNINIDNWLNGVFGPGNDTGTGVTNFGTASTCTVHLPMQRVTPGSGNWKRVPDNWIIPAGCKIIRNDAEFNADIGYAGTLAVMAEQSTGGAGVVPRHFAGHAFNVGGAIPFGKINTNTPGTCRFETMIYWDENLGRINFDLWVTHSQRDIFSGWTLPFNGIYAPVTVAGRTITLQPRGQYLDFVISGFGGIGSAGGQIYVAG